MYKSTEFFNSDTNHNISMNSVRTLEGCTFSLLVFFCHLFLTTTKTLIIYNKENGNGVCKMIQTKAPNKKIMDLFTWSMNNQKYSNKISIKKGDKEVNKQQ